MKKHFFLVAALLLSMLPAMAQLTTGEPHSTVIPRTGNRPQKGDWGIYVGASASQIMDLAAACEDSTATYWGVPVMNVKYYATDNLELRLGFQFDCHLENTKVKFEDEDITAKGTTSNRRNFTRFTPGVAYHFSSKNIVDVYAGAQLPIGWERKVDYAKNTWSDSEESGKAYEKISSGKFVIGAGVFMGLQFFIADLPLAIGIEGGFSGLLKAGGNPKTTIYDDEDGKQVFYEEPGFVKNSRVVADWKLDAALTFSYYFH